MDVFVMDEIAKKEVKTYKYLVIGYETGASGTEHLQGLICWEQPKSLEWMKKNFNPSAHYEVMRGTFQQAADYCKKDGIWTEFGTLPADRGKLVQDMWDEVRENAKAGKFEEIPSEIYVKHLTNIHKLARMHQELPEDTNDTCGVWITGKSGVGKSRYARHHWPEFFHKMPNKWWDGYDHHDYVLIDDLDPTHKYLAYHLKIWMDRYAFPAETKGSTCSIRPKKVIVTSQYTIEQVFDPTDAEAIRRRCQVIQLIWPWTPPEVPNVLQRETVELLDENIQL